MERFRLCASVLDGTCEWLYAMVNVGAGREEDLFFSEFRPADEPIELDNG